MEAPALPTEVQDKPKARRRVSRRFEARREAIIAAAVSEINHRGVRGMTLADVAAHLGLVSTAVIYYFKNKEELAATAFLKSIERFDQLVADAAHFETEAERIRAFVRGYCRFRREVREGQAEEIADTSDLRALGSPAASDAYVAMFRRARRLISRESALTRGDRTGRAIHLLAQLTWAPAWIYHWRPQDYDRIAVRMSDVLALGLAAPGATWDSAPPSDPEPAADMAQEQFLRAATVLINDEGYHGASVDRISARLNLTKGAFYHHNATKDDLVVACFERTFSLMWDSIDRAEASGGHALQILATIAQDLVRRQLGHAPLLRTSALATVPASMRVLLLHKLRRITIRIASILCDGVRDGSIRPVDTSISAQIVSAAINAASELEFWRPDGAPEENVQHYVRTLLTGLVRDA